MPCYSDCVSIKLLLCFPMLGGATTNDPSNISCEQQKSQLNLVAEASLIQCETNDTPKEKVCGCFMKSVQILVSKYLPFGESILYIDM